MSQYTVLRDVEVTEARLDFAKGISQGLLEAMKKGEHFILTSETATDRMIEGLDENLQKSSYAQIKAIYGDYNDMSFYEVVRDSKSDQLDLFRFKGDFGTSVIMEVRTVLNRDGKLAGFFVLPWQDKL